MITEIACALIIGILVNLVLKNKKKEENTENAEEETNVNE